MKLHPAGLGWTKISVCGWQHSNRDSVRTPNGGESSRPRKKFGTRIPKKIGLRGFPGIFCAGYGWVGIQYFLGGISISSVQFVPQQFRRNQLKALRVVCIFFRWQDDTIATTIIKTIKKPRRFSTWVLIFKYYVDVLPIWPTYLWESPNLWSSQWSPRGQRYSYWERARFRNQLVFDYTRWWS